MTNETSTSASCLLLSASCLPPPPSCLLPPASCLLLLGSSSATIRPRPASGGAAIPSNRPSEVKREPHALAFVRPVLFHRRCDLPYSCNPRAVVRSEVLS